jgi:hypothetical protein
MIVGEAEVLIRASTAGLKEEIAAGTDPALAGLRTEAGLAGRVRARNSKRGCRSVVRELPRI